MRQKAKNKADTPAKKTQKPSIDATLVLAILCACQWDLDDWDVKKKIGLWEYKNGYEQWSVLGPALEIKKAHEFPSCINPKPAPVKTESEEDSESLEDVNARWVREQEEARAEEERRKKEAEAILWEKLTPDEQAERWREKTAKAMRNIPPRGPSEEEWAEIHRKIEYDNDDTIFKF